MILNLWKEETPVSVTLDDLNKQGLKKMKGNTNES